MSDPRLPGAHGELVTPDRRPTPWFYRWFQLVHSRIVEVETTTAETAEAVAAIADQPAVSIQGINGVRVSGDQASGFVADGLADQHILASQIFGG